MWDLTVPGNNDHDFYVMAADEGSDGQYHLVDETGVTAVLVHNCGTSKQIDYASDDLSERAFNVRNESGLYDAEHNVAVARVEGGDGSVRFIDAVSGESGHSEQKILEQLGEGDTVTDLYSERQPCPDICRPGLASDPRTQGANITYSVPYFSPSTSDGRFLNEAWTEELSNMISRARYRRGL